MAQAQAHLHGLEARATWHGHLAHVHGRGPRLVLLVLRLALGGVLFYAGFLKLRDGYAFAEAIANFRLLPAQANQIMAVVLPWLEVTTGLLLVFGVWVRAAGLLSALLFVAFLGAIALALWRGLDIECGCFGTGSAARVGLKALAFDAAWLLAALALLWATPPDNPKGC